MAPTPLAGEEKAAAEARELELDGEVKELAELLNANSQEQKAARASRDMSKIMQLMQATGPMTIDKTKKEVEKKTIMDRRLGNLDEEAAGKRVVNSEDGKIQELRRDYPGRPDIEKKVGTLCVHTRSQQCPETIAPSSLTCRSPSICRELKHYFSLIICVSPLQLLECYNELREHDNSTFAGVNMPWNATAGRKATVKELLEAMWARGDEHLWHRRYAELQLLIQKDEHRGRDAKYSGSFGVLTATDAAELPHLAEWLVGIVSESGWAAMAEVQRVRLEELGVAPGGVL